MQKLQSNINPIWFNQKYVNVTAWEMLINSGGMIRTKSSVQSGFPPGGPVCTFHVRWGSQVPSVASREREGGGRDGRGGTERPPCLKNAKKPSAGGG